GPFSIHMWRQSDCLSFTLNYAQEGMNFFEPKIHWSGDDPEGRTASEFPIIYYIVAGLWKIFGQHEWILRAINLLIVYLGLFYLFKFCRKYLESDFWATYIPLLVFTSPVLVYYSNNFLMNAPSFGLVLIALYYYWQFIAQKRTSGFNIALVLFLVAGLLKITALLLFTAILIVHLMSLVPRLKSTFKIPDLIRPHHLISFGAVTLIIFLWIRWSQHYNLI
ncbi:MAG: glycosyltransferase family 39 protein, partial [Bacteroidales bacterium]|nr:glycosyltransferase family 39 protein [Bacteroidales bacterium]